MLCGPEPALAVYPPSDLAEVTVTARKVAEPYQHVPLTIDVLDREQLFAASIADLASLARTAPGLYFESLWGGLGSAPTLRGQSQPSTAGDNVGMFVGGVYQAERTAIDSVPLDLDRVEVVYGPQSALFGHSTFTGAIHYVPRAPTRQFTSGFGLGAGTDGYVEASGYVSGPVTGDRLLGRIAASTQSAGGTWPDAARDARYGGYARNALVGTLAIDRGGSISAELSARWFESVSTHPAQVSIAGPGYDCGAIDQLSGYWSYRCGPLPHDDPIQLSAGLPDSTNTAVQAALAITWEFSSATAESATSYYRGRSDAYRDFDSSGSGELFGVCMFQVNCPASPGSAMPVSRLMSVNSVSRVRPETVEWTQEFRLHGTLWNRAEWLAGIAGYWTDAEELSAIGFGRGSLAQGEALTVLLPLTPAIAGPLARGNRALVNDPNLEQVVQSQNLSSRRTLAAFGAFTWRPIAPLGLRAELRTTRERTKIDSVIANFVPSFGATVPAQEFTDTTPRISIDYAPMPGALLYASAAKGSRSGGVNPIPGLLPEEQGYEPETNWTYELSVRYRDPGQRWLASATVYRIDWDHTQIIGFANTPGIANLITRNTAGVETNGVQMSAEVSLAERLRLHGAFSYTKPRFVTGSDDPGSSAFCGLRGSNRTSTFCTIGPPRSGLAPPDALVPYVDGNFLPRAPERQWFLGLTGDLPALAGGWIPQAAVDVSHQGDVFDRAVNGALYGERTLVSARIAIGRAPWTMELWGTNLTDERYIRAVSSRGATYYPVAPRPLDLVLGDRRRIGITVRFEH